MTNIIQEFILKEYVLSLSTCRDNVPYAAVCFYAFDEKNAQLIFSSKEKTRHIQDALLNAQVAGTILPSRMVKGVVTGLQFSGSIRKATDHKEINSIYYNKFPFARLIEGELWVIELQEIKMTNNKLGLKKQYEWKRNKETETHIQAP